MRTFQHYIDQLQADYNAVAACLAQMGAKQNKERQILHATIQKLKAIKAYIEAARYCDDANLSLGLTASQDWSPRQHHTSLIYLEQRHNILKQILTPLRSMFSYVKSVADSDGYDWLIKFRLPAFKRKLSGILQLQKKAALLQEESEWIKKELNPHSGNQAAAISELLMKVEKLSHRKIKLMRSIETEQQHLQSCEIHQLPVPSMATDPLFIQQFRKNVTASDEYFPIEQRLSTLKKFVKNNDEIKNDRTPN